jgi:plasmid stabilization system protein ParE
MIKQIIWSDFAETQLDEIFDFYEKNASVRVAKKLLRGIIIAPKMLIKAPYIGQEEELLRL